MTESVETFEYMIADYYGSKFAVATDCCTHAIELCLRYQDVKNVNCPNHTYLSVPMTFSKLDLNWTFFHRYWKDYYYIGNTNIIDAAVYWKQDGYVKDSLMCLSFQYKKHLNLGRGGMILTDDPHAALALRKMSYDGRLPNIPWAEQDIDTMGYHYYMTPETAELGIEKFNIVKDTEPREWSWKDYPDLRKMKVFKNESL
jgi:dTDP-4-amino-4,6-dideoxygalactose transaminase